MTNEMPTAQKNLLVKFAREYAFTPKKMATWGRFQKLALEALLEKELVHVVDSSGDVRILGDGLRAALEIAKERGDETLAKSLRKSLGLNTALSF